MGDSQSKSGGLLELPLCLSEKSFNPVARGDEHLPLMRAVLLEDLLFEFDCKTLVLQSPPQIAAGTVDVLCFAACDGAEVVDATFIVNVSEGVDLGLDTSFHVTG